MKKYLHSFPLNERFHRPEVEVWELDDHYVQVNRVDKEIRRTLGKAGAQRYGDWDAADVDALFLESEKESNNA